MAVFFVHDPAKGIVTPLDKKFFRRPIQATEELNEIRRTHSKVESDIRDYPEPSIATQQRKHQDQALQQYLDIAHEDERRLGLVQDYMSHPLLTIEQNKSLSDAWQTMSRHEIHHLAVTNNKGELRALLSTKSILEYRMSSTHQPEQIPLDVFCNEPLVSTAPTTAIESVAVALLQLGLDGMAVTQQHCAIGILTRSDVLKVFLKEQQVNTNA